MTFNRIEYINDDNVTIEQQNITYNISNGRERNRLSNKYKIYPGPVIVHVQWSKQKLKNENANKFVGLVGYNLIFYIQIPVCLTSPYVRLAPGHYIYILLF